MHTSTEHPVTRGWRSSRYLIIATAGVALFTESLLSGFPVPMLPYMLEERLHHDPSQTTDTTAKLLSVQGLITIICTPAAATFCDIIPNQKIPLFLSLGVCLTGTILVASTLTTWALYMGRALQAMAGSVAWIVGTAMITENAEHSGPGTMMGLTMFFVTLGTVSGPTLGGLLLGWAGYWPAWSVPMGMLFLDMVARLVMVQPERHSQDAHASVNQARHGKPCNVDAQNGSPRDAEENVAETSRLLPPSPSTTETVTGFDSETAAEGNKASVVASRNFYAVLLRDIGIWTALVNTMVQAGVRAGFNTTLPVHLRDIFNWGPSSVGASFFALQIPMILLSPVLGWVRDRVGVRYPTTAGWIVLCPLLWCLGIPGSRISWASSNQRTEEAIFVACLCGIGIALPFLQGSGAVHMLHFVNRVESEHHNIFGPNGGSSRCFALTSISFNVGQMLGPLLVGSLFDMIGYYYTNIVLESRRHLFGGGSSHLSLLLSFDTRIIPSVDSSVFVVAAPALHSTKAPIQRDGDRRGEGCRQKKNQEGWDSNHT